MDSTGKAGQYSWMSYKQARCCLAHTAAFVNTHTSRLQASISRTHIASGLRNLGLQAGQTFGLYSVNCRGQPSLCCWPTLQSSLC